MYHVSIFAMSVSILKRALSQDEFMQYSIMSFPLSIGFMSHIEFENLSCLRVEFRGQEPHIFLFSFFSLKVHFMSKDIYFNSVGDFL